MERTQVDVVIGLQYGDEGKGKIANQLDSNFKINLNFYQFIPSIHVILYILFHIHYHKFVYV